MGLTPLQSAYNRGMKLVLEDPRFQSCSPLPHDMYRIILAAVLNAQEEITKKIDVQNEALENIWRMLQALETKTLSGNPEFETRAAAALGLAEGSAPAASGPTLVDKPCATCGEMMEKVNPARKYCDKCKEARK